MRGRGKLAVGGGGVVVEEGTVTENTRFTSPINHTTTTKPHNKHTITPTPLTHTYRTHLPEHTNNSTPTSTCGFMDDVLRGNDEH